jgi:hypothetical protein
LFENPELWKEHFTMKLYNFANPKFKTTEMHLSRMGKLLPGSKSTSKR